MRNHYGNQKWTLGLLSRGSRVRITEGAPSGRGQNPERKRETASASVNRRELAPISFLCLVLFHETPRHKIRTESIPGSAPGERWAWVPGSVYYLVSTFGRVISAHRDLVREVGDTDRAGYAVVGLHEDGRRRKAKVHQLVLEAFVGPCPPGCTQVRHLDGDPANNRLENLAWGTAAENAADKMRHGRSMSGARSPCSKLTPRQVRFARRAARLGVPQRRIAARLGVSPPTVSKAVRGVSYAEVK